MVMEGKALYPLFCGQPPRKKTKVEKDRLCATTRDADELDRERHPVPTETITVECCIAKRKGQSTDSDAPTQPVALIAPSISSRVGDKNQLQQDADCRLPSAELPESMRTKKAKAAPVATGALATLMEAGRMRVSHQRFQ